MGYTAGPYKGMLEKLSIYLGFFSLIRLKADRNRSHLIFSSKYQQPTVCLAVMIYCKV